METLLLLHGVGIGGAVLARRLKVPAGALIGSMLAVLLFTVATGTGKVYPGGLRVVVQMFSGMVIGSRFRRDDARALKTMVGPALVLVGMLSLFNLLFAALMAAVSSVTLTTAFFACAPGGMSDLALIAADFGADMESVALLQLFRFVFVVSFFPPLIRKMFPRPKYRDPRIREISPNEMPLRSRRRGWLNFSLTLLVALAGGSLLNAAGVPAGALIGSLAAVIVFNTATSRAEYPEWMRIGVQIFAGTYIGSKVTVSAIISLPSLMLPMVILLAELFAMAFVTAWVLHKIFKLDYATALFSSIPGGITEMSLISEELGLDTPRIVLMHTCRVIAVFCMLPVAVRLIPVLV